MVKPKKVDTVYKYIGYKLKVVMDTETFCYRWQRNNSQFYKVRLLEEKNLNFRSIIGILWDTFFLI